MSDLWSEPLTIYADYVCPFCYLGRQSLERYQERRGERIEIDWQPFDLRSGKRDPDGGIDHAVDDSEGRNPSGSRTQSGDGKDDEYFEQARECVRRLQREYDVEMAQETRLRGRLAFHSGRLAVRQRSVPERWSEFDETIYDALWQEGRDIEDRVRPRVVCATVEYIVDETGIDGLRRRSVQIWDVQVCADHSWSHKPTRTCRVLVTVPQYELGGPIERTDPGVGLREDRVVSSE